ncbi:MAG: DUF2933 domain-containing protein [Actinomycetota bacterium]
MKRNHLVLVAVAAGGLVVGMLLGGASVSSVLLPLLLLACPLMMVFVGHGSGHSHADGSAPSRQGEGEDSSGSRLAK